MMSARPVLAFVCALVELGATAIMARAEDLNDYPTAARADYVFGCMKANGETRQALDQCSCSIDVVATLLPYERYISAETVDRKSTRLNSSHIQKSRMPSSA